MYSTNVWYQCILCIALVTYPQFYKLQCMCECVRVHVQFCMQCSVIFGEILFVFAEISVRILGVAATL